MAATSNRLPSGHLYKNERAAARTVRAVHLSVWRTAQRRVTGRLDHGLPRGDGVVHALKAGVCRFSFRDLCDMPLGPADYLATAKACSVEHLWSNRTLSPVSTRRSVDARQLVLGYQRRRLTQEMTP
ncbi:hypothetical protein PRNP1_006848 [Phytophthora ramorum]